MKIDIITKQDLEFLKNGITKEVTAITQSQKQNKWLRSSEVREMLNISSGTLQNMRINGTILFSKLGGTLFYNLQDILNTLEVNKSIGQK